MVVLEKGTLEFDFKKYWEQFRASTSEKEKEEALGMAVEIFCKLAKLHSDVSHLITTLIEAHIFSFVVGRAFVTDIEKLKIVSKTRALEAVDVMRYLSEVDKGGLSVGSILLRALEVLVSVSNAVQPLIDSGIFSCLIHILNVFLLPTDAGHKLDAVGTSGIISTKGEVRRLEIEASIIHIMKALAGHSSVAQNLIEDDSLQLLFQMVADGSFVVFSRFKQGLPLLHTIQLHRHAMQILSLLLVNDSGSTAKYIHKHHLVKILLMSVKDFNPENGNPAYTVGIVDLLLECMELSYKAEANGIMLREDMHNAHGYQFLVQFALVLSSMQTYPSQPIQPCFLEEEPSSNETSRNICREDGLPALRLSPSLTRLLDVLVSLAQLGPKESSITVGGRSFRSSGGRVGLHSRNHTPDKISDGFGEKGNTKVKDLEAIRMLQDIFLKADNVELQVEVLNRMLNIFSSDLENYQICQQLKTLPLFILNMVRLPQVLRDKVIEILVYAATVVNCTLDQELLSLCFLLQQPTDSELRYSVLSFFVKLISFDQKYKKVLREVGVLDVLLDDLKQHKYLIGPEYDYTTNLVEKKCTSDSLKKHMEDKDVIISSPKMQTSPLGKIPIFDDEKVIPVAWDCLVSLVTKAESNQLTLRSSCGLALFLPFLSSSIHYAGVLRLLSCLISEDASQVHTEELGSLIEILKSGIIIGISGSQYELLDDAKCSTLQAVGHILEHNTQAQRIFGEYSGFSLLLTTLSGFQNEGECTKDACALLANLKVFSFVVRAITAGVQQNPINRSKLHAVLSSQSFYDLLRDSGLLSVECEKQVVRLLLELAMEIMPSRAFVLHAESLLPADHMNVELTPFHFDSQSSPRMLDRQRVYNAEAIATLIRFLLSFTPKLQLELLIFIEQLAEVDSFNLEKLTSVGCVGLILDVIRPFLATSAPILTHACKIVEILGSYKLSSAELRILVRYILQTRLMYSGNMIVETMERLLLKEDAASGDVALGPFLELELSKTGHAAIEVSLGQRTWPPAAGYSFVCWFQFHRLFRARGSKENQPFSGGSCKGKISQSHAIRIFSVEAAEDSSTLYAEVCLQDDGVLTLATSKSSSLSFPALDLEEGRWHHLAIVHSKPNALAGLFQASMAYVYLNGNLRHTGKLGYSSSPFGRPLQVSIGTSIGFADVSELFWRLRSCYLFEEVLMPGDICFIYLLGRGYRGLFQDVNLLQFVPVRACGGGSMAMLDSLDIDIPLGLSGQRTDVTNKKVNMTEGSVVWDLERLNALSHQLSGKKLIFAFDGTRSETCHLSGDPFILNLVDPSSAVVSPIGGIARFGRLRGDIHLCNPCLLGEGIRAIGGMAVLLALIEAAETKKMLHMALTLLAFALHQCPQNVKDMQACKGYHLLALFLRHQMPLFDLSCLEVFFQIAACEASFTEPFKLPKMQSNTSSGEVFQNESYEDLPLTKFPDEIDSVGSQEGADISSMQRDNYSQLAELDNIDTPQTEASNCIVLANADMVEHVLLDWTLWVTASVQIQVQLLGFLERLVSLHWYRNHNLTVLRKMNLVQHLLVTLQRGDVEVPVIEKLVILLGVILEDGFLASELDIVVRFVIMTFDPPALSSRYEVVRESMGKHVIVRNMLLEMLIDLQVTISSEELLEQWHKIVSSKLITYFLDEALHPTSMKWLMTLLGVCLASSPSFVSKFRSSGGFRNLMRVLPSFYDSPELYYTLFCLIFGKPVYPRLPEVRMLDFHALMHGDESYGELNFLELLDSVIGMVKATFDRLSLQFRLALQVGSVPQFSSTMVSEFMEGTADVTGDLQGEALMHKTYAARLMSGEAAAPAVATSILRFMVDLTKVCPSFSAACKRAEFLETCVDLYFSCIRAACAVKMSKGLSSRVSDEKKINDSDDNCSSHNTFSILSQEHTQSPKASNIVKSSTTAVMSTSSDDLQGSNNDFGCDNMEKFTKLSLIESGKLSGRECLASSTLDSASLAMACSLRTSIHEFDNFDHINSTSDILPSVGSLSFTSLHASDSSILSGRSKTTDTSHSPSIVAPMPWLTSIAANNSEGKAHGPANSPVSASSPGSECDQDLKSSSEVSSPDIFVLNARHLLETDAAGFGGGPCSSAATAILDFIAEVLADIVSEQLKAVQVIEVILENVPLHVDTESVLVFQGLCLSRLMNFLERRLLWDDEEHGKKLDKSRWSVNLDNLCWMIVDRVYMGAFPQPGSVLRTLEFLLSMLQLANKDGRVEEASPVGKGLLSISRGNRQLEGYVNALFKNTNRMIMYCFLPSFLCKLGEGTLLSSLRMQMEQAMLHPSVCSEDEKGINICTVLQLLIAHKRLVICPSNHDTDLTCCLCLNLIHLLRSSRKNAKNMSMDILKYLLLHRRSFMGDLLVCKQIQGQNLDILHGGFDKLLTGSSSTFFDWLQNSEETINRVLEQCAAIMWSQFVTGSAKFPGIRIKSLEVRRKKEMSRKSRDAAKLDLRHWDQAIERRYALELIRDAMSTELRVLRQDKYGWVLHAEREWQSHLQQLTHERGIFTTYSNSFQNCELKWQLNPIEGPYRMRKKLERYIVNADSIQNLINKQLEVESLNFASEKCIPASDASKVDSDLSLRHLLSVSKNSSPDGLISDEILFHEEGSSKDGISLSGVHSNEDKCSSINDSSLYSAAVYGAKFSIPSVPTTESNKARSDLSFPWQSSSFRAHERFLDERLDKYILDNGEYLIRPYLEPLEKIKFRYNCERVVGLDKHDGIFLIGEFCLYVIENFFIDSTGCIHEKECEDELSIIDQALGVKKTITNDTFHENFQAQSCVEATNPYAGGRAWAYNGGAWGKEQFCVTNGNIRHPWRMWKLDSVHELLKRDYQLRPVAIEIFSMNGYNDLLVFHKKERDDAFRNLVAMNLPRNSMLDKTVSGSSKQDNYEANQFFRVVAKSISKRWQIGEISNFHYLMHLNTLAGRGYNDLTQYPVFPWVLADYESKILDLNDPKTFRKFDKPMGCQTSDGEEEFKKRYESWEDMDVPKFHYGSHYSSAGIVLFYLVRLQPFSNENLKLQGGQFDHADRLFNSVKDTWLSAAGRSNTSDVKELIPEFFYMPEFLENKFHLNLGEKQSGEKVGDVVLPPWAKGSAREFIRMHREALESDYVSENLHRWIDLIFGYKQRGKAAEEAVNVFYHYTYEGNVDIDTISDPAMKASILAQINHFGQTPKQLFQKPHVRRRSERKLPLNPLNHAARLIAHDVRKGSPIYQILVYNDKILTARSKTLLKPTTYNKYIAWGFPDRSLRFFTYDQDKLLSTYENLHPGSQIHSVGISRDGRTLVTGGDDGVLSVWQVGSSRGQRQLNLKRSLCGHKARVTCLYVSQPYTLIVSGSDDCSILLWDLSSLSFVRQLPSFSAPVSAVYVNDMTGEIVTAAGIVLAVWSINGDSLAVVNTTQLPSDFILSVTGSTFSDWFETNWYITGHHSGALKVWHMVRCTDDEWDDAVPGSSFPEYSLQLQKVLKAHNHAVTALNFTNDLKQLISGDAGGHLVSWTLAEQSLKVSSSHG